MKKVLFMLVAMSIIFVSCKKNDVVGPTPPKSVEFTRSSATPVENVDVTISAVVKNFVNYIVTLEWSKDGNPQENIVMTAGADNTYTGIIPGQPAGTTVTFLAKVTDSEGYTSGSGTILWMPDLSMLRLNEINGVISNQRIYVELHNIGTEPISLAGLEIWQVDVNFVGEYPGQVMWRGAEGQVIEPGGFFIMQSRNQTTVTSTQIFPGLTSSRALTLTLRYPSVGESMGDIIDEYSRNGNDAAMNELFGTPGLFGSSMGSVRIPDGTGKWYFFSGYSTGTGSGSASEELGTPNAPNPQSPEGLIKHPDYTDRILEVPPKP